MNTLYSPCRSVGALLALMSLAGCMAFDDARIRQAMQNGQLKIGTPKHEAHAALGGQPSFCVKRKMTSENSMELWDFVSTGCAANLTENYVLIFRNDTLAEIRTVHSQLDMQF